MVAPSSKGNEAIHIARPLFKVGGTSSKEPDPSFVHRVSWGGGGSTEIERQNMCTVLHSAPSKWRLQTTCVHGGDNVGVRLSLLTPSRQEVLRGNEEQESRVQGGPLVPFKLTERGLKEPKQAAALSQNNLIGRCCRHEPISSWPVGY